MMSIGEDDSRKLFYELGSYGSHYPPQRDNSKLHITGQKLDYGNPIFNVIQRDKK